MRKKSTISKISIVWCISSRTDQFVTNLNVIFIKKKLLSKPFFPKKIRFLHFDFEPKNFEVKENCSKNTAKRLPI